MSVNKEHLVTIELARNLRRSHQEWCDRVMEDTMARIQASLGLIHEANRLLAGASRPSPAARADPDVAGPGRTAPPACRPPSS